MSEKAGSFVVVNILSRHNYPFPTIIHFIHLKLLAFSLISLHDVISFLSIY